MIVLNSKGLTIAELLVVLFFIAMIATTAVVAVTMWVPGRTMDSDLSKISAAVAAARSKAILGGTDVTLEVDTANGRYAVLPDAVEETPDMVVIEKLAKNLSFTHPPGYSPPPTNMNQTFNLKGILKNDVSSKYIYVANPGKEIYKRLRISPAGTTAVEAWDGDSWIQE